MKRMGWLVPLVVCAIGCSGSKSTSADEKEILAIKAGFKGYRLNADDFVNQPNAHTGKPNLNALYDQYRLLESERPKVPVG